MRKLLKFFAVAILLIMSICIVGCASEEKENVEGSSSATQSQFTMSDINKEITQYTWEDFESLSGDEQIKFQSSFETEEDFEAWMNDAKAEDYNLPWENGGKQPAQYTWEEFEALSGAQQIQFQNSFDSIDDFDDWLKSVKTE